jgi:hypothetical protein
LLWLKDGRIASIDIRQLSSEDATFVMMQRFRPVRYSMAVVGPFRREVRLKIGGNRRDWRWGM